MDAELMITVDVTSDAGLLKTLSSLITIHADGKHKVYRTRCCDARDRLANPALTDEQRQLVRGICNELINEWQTGKKP